MVALPDGISIATSGQTSRNFLLLFSDAALYRGPRQSSWDGASMEAGIQTRQNEMSFFGEFVVFVNEDSEPTGRALQFALVSLP